MAHVGGAKTEAEDDDEESQCCRNNRCEVEGCKSKTAGGAVAAAASE